MDGDDTQTAAPRFASPPAVRICAVIAAPTSDRSSGPGWLRFAYWPCLILTLLLAAATGEMARLGLMHARKLGPWAAGTLVLLLCAALLTGVLFRKISRQPTARRHFWFAHIQALLVGVVLLLTVRVGLKPVVPAWPMRDLRPTTIPEGNGVALAELPPEAESYGAYNSWGMRDLERTVEKPAGKKRILFIGDSFLEGGHCDFPLAMLAEKQLGAQGRTDVECVNLGVSATDPSDYYYRLREVGSRLNPDAVFVFLYAGNDFIEQGQRFDHDCRALVTTLAAERPRPSFCGSHLPELNWLLCNRLNWSKLGQGQAGIADEWPRMKTWTTLSFEAGTELFAEHFQRNYFPNESLARIRAVLQRGGPERWTIFKQQPRDQEFLQPWIVKSLLAFELAEGKPLASTAEVDPKHVNGATHATYSWLRGMRDLCKQAGVPLVVFLCPTGAVDPNFMTYWEPWPRYRAANFLCEARLELLHRLLAAKHYQVVDLRETLHGVNDTYRKTDAHWNELGHRLVAERVRAEISRLR